MNNTKDNLIAERDRLRAVNAALLAALKEIAAIEPASEQTDYFRGRNQGIAEAAYYARAAIALAEQGAKGQA